LVRLETTRGRVVIGTRDRLAELLGTAPPAPALAGYQLRCKDAAQVAQRCEAAGFTVNRNRAVALPPALGGAWLLA